MCPASFSYIASIFALLEIKITSEPGTFNPSTQEDLPSSKTSQLQRLSQINSPNYNINSLSSYIPIGSILPYTIASTYLWLRTGCFRTLNEWCTCMDPCITQEDFGPHYRWLWIMWLLGIGTQDSQEQLVLLTSATSPARVLNSSFLWYTVMP